MNWPDFIPVITIFSGVIWIGAVVSLGLGLNRIARTRSKQQPELMPVVTVLIAARNEEAQIRQTLEAIVAQDYPVESWEALILDDHSEDRTAAIVAEFTSRYPNLKLIPVQDCQTDLAPKKNALQQGLAQARGTLILTTDADCQPLSGWISGIVRQFQTGIDVVVGFSPLHGSGLVGTIGAFDAFVNAVVAAGSIGLGHPTTAVGRNFSYRREAWTRVGGFGRDGRGASGDDDLLLQRISAQGGTVVFATDPATFVSSQTKTSLADWWQMKRRHYSAGKRYQPGLIGFAVLLYLFQLGLVTTAILSLWGLVSPLPGVAIWLIKVLADGLALRAGARLLNYGHWFGTFLLAELLTPLLFTILIPWSLVGKVQWKGRKLAA